MALKIFLAFVALLSLSFAALTLEDLRASLPVVMFIMVVVLAATYMLSKTINSPQLEVWVRGEIRELIIGAVLFVIVMAAFYGSTPLLSMLTGTDNYQEQAKVFLSDMLLTASNSFEDVMKAFHYIGLRAGYSTSAALPGWYFAVTFAGAPYSGYSSFFLFLSQAASGLSNILFFYTALDVFLDFFLVIGDKLIFLAFAIRFIPFTRLLGSTLIALILGAYILFPFSLVLANNFHGLMGIDLPHPRISGEVFSRMEFDVPPGLNMFCKTDAGSVFLRTLFINFGEVGFSVPPCLPALLIPGGFATCYNILAQIVYPLLLLLLGAAYSLILTFNSLPLSDLGEDAGAIFDGLQGFLIAVNNLVVVSIVDAITIGIVTIVGTKSISVALGGEYFMPAVQRFV